MENLAGIVIVAILASFGLIMLVDSLVGRRWLLKMQGHFNRSRPYFDSHRSEIESMYVRAHRQLETTGKVEINTWMESYYLPEFSQCQVRLQLIVGTFFLVFGGFTLVLILTA